MKLLISISALALLLGSYGSARAQAPSDVVTELLATPAPLPRSAFAASESKKERPRDFFDDANIPPDDAPLEDLVDYWSRRAHASDTLAPSDTVRRRLLNAAVDDLKALAFLLPLFPPSESYAEKIKQAFDNGAGNPELEDHRQEIRKWLVFNSKYFLGELLSLANKVKDDDDGGYVDNSAALVSLTKIDWSVAEPLLETLAANNGQPRSATLALTLLYQHSIDEKDADAELKLRSKLQAIASDRSFPGRARDDAIEALSESEWSGRDEWYLSLFQDESLLQLRDGMFGFSSLSTLFTREPDKWMPVMTKLVAGKDRTLQQAAASCLVRYAIAKPRREAILPVLRWLTEPDWIPLRGDRTSFVQTMGKVDVPESVPGLIWIVENEVDQRRQAARTLARYKDVRAIPALKKALAEVREDDRPFILDGLLASGGLTEAEQVKALEAYATMRTTTASGSEGTERYPPWEEALPLPVSIGRYLAQQNTPPDTLVRAVLTRAASLRAKNVALSHALVEIAHGWQGRQIELDMIERIATNTAQVHTIIIALNKRANLRESVRTELHLLIASHGVPKGIGAILLEDDDIVASILSSSDHLAQIGLLAAARLAQTPLSMDLVGPLLKSKNSLLAMAAERYLLAEDSKEAQKILWQHHRQQAFITGWRENFHPLAGGNFERIGKEEEKLRAELFKPGGPLEIFALLNNTEHQRHVLRIYADKAVYTFYEDPSRYHERVVPKNELSVFQQFVSTNGLVDLGPQFGRCHHDCWVSEFLMLSKDTARRVFSHQTIDDTLTILENFQRLGRGDGTTTRYSFETEIKGLEVLYADQSLTVLDVWQRDNEIRILVERPETEEEAASRTRNYPNDDDEKAQAEFWQRQHAGFKARLSWRNLKDKDASSITTAPDGYSTFDDTRFPFDEIDGSGRREERQMQVLTPDSILIARNLNGLWKQTAGSKAVRISSDNGAYANPIVTPDGKWAFIAKTDTEWSGPNYLVRLNLETGQESRVKLEPAENLLPIAFLPLHGKILLRSVNDPPDLLSGKPVGPEVAAYFLLDPKTDAVQSISGEFAPLGQEGKRFLQPTGEPGQYWTAIPDDTKKQTVVGHYNLKDFSFKPVLTVPRISFDSLSMWVDEKQQKLYFVYKGQLLRLPLPNAPQ